MTLDRACGLVNPYQIAYTANMNEFEIMASNTARKELPRMSKVADGLTRQDVVNAFHRAFTMIGGVNRLALWASQNEDEFYRLYARLLPSATVNIGVQMAPRIIHALRPTALDNHPGQVIDLKTGLIIEESAE